MPNSIGAREVKTIIFACEAGVGSSVMSVNAMKKKLKKAHITDVKVVHMPAREIPQDATVVVVHKSLGAVVRAKAPHAVVLTFNVFLNDPVFDVLLKALVEKTEITAAA